mgnify:CR=1 FL=1
MVLRGRGAFLKKGPSPLKLPERLAPPAPKAFPCGLQTDSGAGRADQNLPGGWGDEALRKAQEGNVGIPRN